MLWQTRALGLTAMLALGCITTSPLRANPVVLDEQIEALGPATTNIDHVILEVTIGGFFTFDCPLLGFKPSSSRRNCFSTKANRCMLNSLESWTPPSGEKGP